MSSIDFGQLAQKDARRNKKGVKKYHLFKKGFLLFGKRLHAFVKNDEKKNRIRINKRDTRYGGKEKGRAEKPCLKYLILMLMLIISS